jgi:hypothetical protein
MISQIFLAFENYSFVGESPDLRGIIFQYKNIVSDDPIDQ